MPIKGKGEKARLRAFYRKELTKLPPLIKRQKEKQIEDLLLKLPFWSNASHIAGFLALKEEPLLSSFYKLYENKLCFPYMSQGRLEFYRLKGATSLSKNLTGKHRLKSKDSSLSKDQEARTWLKTGISTNNPFSIPEPYPLAENKVPLKKISVFLIPALAFDRQGGRLGRGSGFYDKSLTKLLPSNQNSGSRKQLSLSSPAKLSKINEIDRKPKQTCPKVKTDASLDFWMEFFNHHRHPVSSPAANKGGKKGIETKNSQTKKTFTKQTGPPPLQHLKKACFIGVAFSLQIQPERLSLESHDIPMDLLVSEDFILMPLNRGRT